MQFPKEETERLIVFASSNLIPFEPDLEILSDPARSTIVNKPFL